MSSNTAAQPRSWKIQIQHRHKERYVNLGARFTTKQDAYDQAKWMLRGTVAALRTSPNGIRIRPSDDLPNQVWNIGAGKWDYVADVSWDHLMFQARLAICDSLMAQRARQALVTFALDRAARCTDPDDVQFWSSQAIVYSEATGVNLTKD
jgi:hypothetical protein